MPTITANSSSTGMGAMGATPLIGEMVTPFTRLSALPSKDIFKDPPPKNTSAQDSAKELSIHHDVGDQSPNLCEPHTPWTHPQETLDCLTHVCGNYYIQPEQLRYMRRIGTGTFATVHVAQLLPPAGAAVPLPTPTKTQNDLSHHSTFSESSSCGRRPLHEWYGQQVAVKRLNRAALTNARDFSDFVMEASVLQKIQHNCIVSFIGVGTTITRDTANRGDGQIFVVTELLGGGTLQHVLMKQMTKPHCRLYTNSTALRWCHQIARGLRYLHNAKPMIIHRDLKPENVLLTSEPSLASRNAKLADFGLHVRIRRDLSNCLVDSSKSSADGDSYEDELDIEGRMESIHNLRTNSGIMMRSATLNRYSISQAQGAHADGQPSYALTALTGSLLYMAPEVFNGHAYSEKVDVFGLGMIMYELFSRTLLSFTLQDPDVVFAHCRKVCTEGYRPPFPRRMPAGVKSLVQQCWAQDPAARPSMDKVVEALAALRVDDVEEKSGGGVGCFFSCFRGPAD